MNFTASYLGYRKKKGQFQNILDEFGNRISTIKITEDIYPIRYQNPSIYVEIYEKRNDLKEPIIKKISFSELEALGFSICSIPIPKEKRWSASRVLYCLLRKGSLEEQSAKKITETRRKGNVHKILYDTANLRIKLIGKNADKTGEGPWVNVKKL